MSVLDASLGLLSATHTASGVLRRAKSDAGPSSAGAPPKPFTAPPLAVLFHPSPKHAQDEWEVPWVWISLLHACPAHCPHRGPPCPCFLGQFSWYSAHFLPTCHQTTCLFLIMFACHLALVSAPQGPGKWAVWDMVACAVPGAGLTGGGCPAGLGRKGGSGINRNASPSGDALGTLYYLPSVSFTFHDYLASPVAVCFF